MWFIVLHTRQQDVRSTQTNFRPLKTVCVCSCVRTFHCHWLRQVNAIDADFILISLNGGLEGESDGSIFGHQCASKAVAVGAIDWLEADGPGHSFEGMWCQGRALVNIAFGAPNPI